MNEKEIAELLNSNPVIAVIGASKNLEKDSHKVFRYLLENGFKTIPVNPTAQEILNQKCYPSLSDIPFKIDIVDVFRPSEEAVEFTKQAIEKKAKVVWLQLGIENQEAKALAESNGLKFVQNKCIKIEHLKINNNA